MLQLIAYDALGYYYFDIEKNYIETKKYFEFSSKQNRSIGLCYMDILYSKGLGVELN